MDCVPIVKIEIRVVSSFLPLATADKGWLNSQHCNKKLMLNNKRKANTFERTQQYKKYAGRSVSFNDSHEELIVSLWPWP